MPPIAKKQKFKNALVMTTCSPSLIKTCFNSLSQKYSFKNIDLFISNEFQGEKTFILPNISRVIYYKYSDIGYNFFVTLKKYKPDVIILIIDHNLKEFYVRLEFLAFALPAKFKLYIEGGEEERVFPNSIFYRRLARKFLKIFLVEVFCSFLILPFFFFAFFVKTFFIFLLSWFSKKELKRQKRLWSIIFYGYKNLLKNFKGINNVGSFLPLVFFVWLDFIANTRLSQRLKNAPRGVLFIRLEHLGDVINSTPAFRALRKTWPNSIITLAVGRWSKDVIKHCPYINEILVYPTNNKWHLRGKKDRVVFLKQLWFFIKLRMRDYDLVIDPCGWPETYKLVYMSGSKLKVVNDYGRWDFNHNILRQKLLDNDNVGLPEAKRTLNLLKLINIKEHDVSTELWLSQDEQRIADDFLRENKIGNNSLIGLHPGAPWPQRRWPIERFAQLADRITEKYKLPILVFAGPGEEELIDQILKFSKKTEFIPIKQKNLREVMAIIARCSVFVCNDSGPMHIAVAFKVPTVAIFGPGGVVRWAPSSPPHVVIRNPHITCTPCSQISCGDNICLTSITVDQVWEGVQKLIQISGIGKK